MLHYKYTPTRLFCFFMKRLTVDGHDQHYSLKAGVNITSAGISHDTTPVFMKKALKLSQAEGEGFEPPGRLTQLFSRQPQ